MFNLKITMNTNRVNDMEMLATTIAQALDRRGVSTSGATVSLNGRILSAVDYGKTFEEMGVVDGGNATLSVVVKADSAC